MGSLEMPSSGRKPPPRQVRTQEERARLGVAIASGLALVFVVILAYVVLTSTGASTRPREHLPTPPEAPQATANPIGIMGAKNTRFEFVDQNDPSRTAGRLIFQSMDPLEGHNYAVDLPEAWIYPRDGGAIRVRAQSGRLYMPGASGRTSEPESGRLAGDVVVDVYARTVDNRPIDPEHDRPGLTFKTRSLNFDTTLGSVTTSDPFTITSDQADFSGEGLDILLNRAAQRLEMLQIAKSDALTIYPDRVRQSRRERAARPTASPAPTAVRATSELAAAPTSETPSTPPASTPAPSTTRTSSDVHYRATFAQNVTLTQNQRTIEADALTLWTRMVNGKLPENAIAPIRVARITPATAATPTVAATPPPWLAAPVATHPETDVAVTDNPLGPLAQVDEPATGPTLAATQPRRAAENPDAPIILRWAGPCVVQPLEAAPDELQRDHLALRFSANGGGLVHARDASRNAVISASAIDYGATSRRLTLAGEPERPATFDIPEAGQAQAARLEANLTTGLIHMPGASTFTVAPRDPGTPDTDRPRLACTEQADLTLEIVNGELTNAIKQATFSGDVAIHDRASSLLAEFVRADFVRTPTRPAALTRLIAQGGADMRSGDAASGGRLRAESIDVAFNPASSSSSPEPSAITAERGVKVDREGERLEANFLEATLAKNNRGAIDISSAHARDAINYASDTQNLAMNADELRADLSPDAAAPGGRRRIIDLTGRKVMLARAQETAISGTQMRLDGQGPRIEVFGAGEFTHHAPSSKPGPAGEPVMTEAHATWSRAMNFDDATGIITCEGDAIATASPDPRTRDRFQGERITITLAPREASPSAPAPGGQPLDPTRSAQRRVLSAKAQGSILDRECGTNAKVESRRYTAPPVEGIEPALEQAVYLEGPSIAADNTLGTLDVPAAGRLLLRDARERPETSGTASSPDGRGDALFDWDGSMRYRRETGQMELTRNVRLTHRRLQDALVTNLRCDRLIAGVNVPTPGESEGKDAKPQLTSVNATGSVYVSSGTASKAGEPPPPQRELSADMVEYDTVRSVIAARANPGGSVSFIDTARGAPVNAASILWNLIEDRISVDSPRPVSAPR